MTETEKYRKRLSQAIWNRGSPVSTGRDTFYGWADYDATMHARECKLKSYEKILEVDWYQFVSTFDDASHEYGLEMTGVYCACGQIKNRVFRLNETFGVVMREMFKGDILDGV